MALCHEPVGAFAQLRSLSSAYGNASLSVAFHTACIHTSVVETSCLIYFLSHFFLSKGAEGQDTKGELQEGAAVRHSPSE